MRQPSTRATISPWGMSIQPSGSAAQARHAALIVSSSARVASPCRTPSSAKDEATTRSAHKPPHQARSGVDENSQVEAVAVCLLHSYANPAHEQEVGSVLARELPGLAVTLSSELVPEIREYDRASTTVANVYVRNIAEQYLGRLKHRLAQELRLDCSAFVMQSNGGVCEIETAQQYPIKLVESGPAGGALAAAHYGKLTGHPDLLSFDMGGTTAKACMIVGGEPVIAREFEIDRRYQFKKGSGLPVKVPVSLAKVVVPVTTPFTAKVTVADAAAVPSIW